MPSYTLRYQAASFDDNVFDAQQLSRVRGASLSYLYSGERVERVLARAPGLNKLQRIYTGASQGAFAFQSNGSAALAARSAVENALKRSDLKKNSENDNAPTGCHEHLGYVVALAAGDDTRALFAAESLCNVKKLQHESFRLPPYVGGANKPGGRRDPRPASMDDEQGRSAAMKSREEFGRSQRQAFYQRMSGQDPGFDFTDNLQEIIAGADQALPLSLHDKVAVFYADGDKFGTRFKNAARSGVHNLGSVSNTLKDKQRQLLRDILAWLGEHYASGATNHYFMQGAARFETLLWGGDENLFVMPSWLGMEFAELFYEKTRDWTLEGDAPWTFSAGLVICDGKTPIRQIRNVAKELTERNKAFGGAAIQIEVFESLSMPDVDFDSYRRNLYIASDDELGEVNRQLSIPGDKLGELIKAILRLKEPDGLPRSQLYKMLHKASQAGAAVARSDEIDRQLREDFALWKKRAGRSVSIEEGDIDVLRNLRPWGEAIKAKRPAFSLSLGMVAMLWDYARPLHFAGQR
jgi:hypothetical protein